MENISFDSALLLNSSSTAPSQKNDRVYDFRDSIASGEEFEARYSNLADRIAVLNFISDFVQPQYHGQ